jgi:hypothetical protein
MNINFVTDFLCFIRFNNIKTKTTYDSVTLTDGKGNEVATIAKNGRVVVPMGEHCEASDEFISLLIDNQVKIEEVRDEEYDLLQGFNFIIGKEVYFTIPNDDNKIVINL